MLEMLSYEAEVMLEKDGEAHGRIQKRKGYFVKFCEVIVSTDFVILTIKAGLATMLARASDALMLRKAFLGGELLSVEKTRAWSLQRGSLKQTASLMLLHGFFSRPLLQRLMLPAVFLPSSSPVGTSAGCGSGWDSWAGISFIDSCARSAYHRPTPCCAKADWLNQTMVNLLLMFHASLNLPIVAAVIAPILLVWLSDGSQPGPGDGKSR